MNWETFYLLCFVIGLSLSLFTLLAGAHFFHIHFHLPGDVHLGDAGGLDHGGANLPAGPGGAPHPGGVRVGGIHAAQHSPFSFSTLMAFLAWFGGTGYLLVRYSNVWAVLALGIATLSGIGGGAIVFWFTVKVLLAHETVMDAADYVMTGVLGKVSVGIRPGGTGEIIYSQAGTRRTCGARSEEGIAIPKGSEVVVERYERGIAYVRRWEDVAADGEAKSDN